MVTGLPHAVHARNGNEDASQAYSSWNASYMPHYGIKGAEKPLMDHVSVASVSALAGQGVSNTWRLELTSLPAVSKADDPLTAKDIRAGVTLKLDF
jgi:nitrogen fixation protein